MIRCYRLAKTCITVVWQWHGKRWVKEKKKICFVLEVFFVVYDRRGEAIVLEFIYCCLCKGDM